MFITKILQYKGHSSCTYSTISLTLNKLKNNGLMSYTTKND